MTLGRCESLIISVGQQERNLVQLELGGGVCGFLFCSLSVQTCGNYVFLVGMHVSALY